MLEELGVDCQCYAYSLLDCFHAELQAFVYAMGKSYDCQRWCF
jgi:hypothetical protein